MIWKRKRMQRLSLTAAGEMTGAKGRTGAGAFAKKNWKWLVPLVVVASGRWFILIGGGRNGAERQPRHDLRRDDAHPSGCLQHPQSGTGTLNPANTYTVKSLVDGQDPHRWL